MSVELYDALCLKEPWLELILLDIKGLETRTRLMRKKSGDVVLASSKSIDFVAWNDPDVGGRLDDAAKQRALAGLGKLRGLAHMSGFRVGVSGVDDARACIAIALPDNKLRFVSEVTRQRRLVEVPTVRYRDGLLLSGASQGFFRVPASHVRIL